MKIVRAMYGIMNKNQIFFSNKDTCATGERGL